MMKHNFDHVLAFICFTLLFLCSGCGSSQDSKPNPRLISQKGEYIYRKSGEILFVAPPAKLQPPPVYPWDKKQSGNYPKITKEHFRCKGSSLNPCRMVQEKTDVKKYEDCSGSESHSLPIRDGKEFIYTILIELVNHVQEKTGKRVVITSGHRCPTHNLYVDPTLSNRSSKHTIGAEVSFYVQGMEERPEVAIFHLQQFYKENPRYQGIAEYEEFKRYESGNTDVSINPWFNKEIFIKCYQKKEGRNFDNRHPYPYISIQARFDRELNERITYSWNMANCNYHRW